ncbi:MAG: hypothetical protein WBX01_09100 [Nitrososphaeraceae archaeon]
MIDTFDVRMQNKETVNELLFDSPSGRSEGLGIVSLSSVRPFSWRKDDNGGINDSSFLSRKLSTLSRLMQKYHEKRKC